MIALFQDQIVEHQTLAEHYRELAMQREKLAQSLLAIEQEASGAFQALANITQKIQDSKAIATLKFALLDLFDGRGDGGNQPTDPTPGPQPNPPGGIEEIHIAAVGTEDEEEDELEQQYDFEDEGDEEQKDTAEDTGEEELIFHPDNHAIAYIPSDVGKLTAVIGFASKGVVASWEKFIEPMGAVELSDRPAFMEGYKYELRAFGLSMAQITRLAQQDFSKRHTVKADEIGTATPPESKKKFVPKSVKVGDRVTRLLVPSEVFEVTTAPAADGTFFAKSALNGDRQLFSLEDVNVLSSLPESAPKYATVLLPGDKWEGHKLQITAESELGLTLQLPNGENYWYRRDVVQVCDAEIEAIASPTQPAKSTERIHPVTQRPNLVQPAFGEAPGGLPEELAQPDTHSILGVGDIVQVLSDRYPQFLEHICTVIGIDTEKVPPILVKGVRGIKPYHRNELKLISKAKASASEKELVAAGAEFNF